MTLPRSLGRAERSLQSLLRTILARQDLDFPGWTALVFLDAAPLTSEALLARQRAGRVVADDDAARAVLADLLRRGWVAQAADGWSRTPAGEAAYQALRAEVSATVGRLTADVAAGDLAVTERVLDQIAARAAAELDAPG